MVDVILAHSFFGEKLPREHGAPVRVVIPDRYFYKSAKWLEGIKVSARDEPGYWESMVRMVQTRQSQLPSSVPSEKLARTALMPR